MFANANKSLRCGSRNANKVSDGQTLAGRSASRRLADIVRRFTLDAVRRGCDVRSARDAAQLHRYRSSVSLSLIGRIAEQITTADDGSSDMTLVEPSLFGYRGRLPLWMTRRAAGNDKQARALRELFDALALQAAAALRIEAIEAVSQGRAFERAVAAGRSSADALVDEEPACRRLFEMLGIDRELLTWLGVPPAKLLRNLGLLTSGPTREGLRSLLADCFLVPVKILKPPPKYRRIGGCFRVEIGPLGLSDYRQFAPPRGSCLASLVRLTRHYAGDDAHFDLRLVLRADELRAELSHSAADSPRLDWNLWLVPPDGERTEPMATHISETDCLKLHRTTDLDRPAERDERGD